MKTELQIAKENVKISKRFMSTAPIPNLTEEAFKTVVKGNTLLGEIKSHKQTCQRFLGFLEEEMKRWETINELSKVYISTGELEEKITDLKDAIKYYKENGI